MVDQAKPTTAPERLKLALDARQAEHKALYGADAELRGYKGPKREQAYIELSAGDIAECCAGIAEHDEITRALHTGGDGKSGTASLPPERRVTIQADALYHLLERSSGGLPQPQPDPSFP